MVHIHGKTTNHATLKWKRTRIPNWKHAYVDPMPMKFVHILFIKLQIIMKLTLSWHWRILFCCYWNQLNSKSNRHIQPSLLYLILSEKTSWDQNILQTVTSLNRNWNGCVFIYFLRGWNQCWTGKWCNWQTSYEYLVAT